MIIKTIQTYTIEYEVPDTELMRFERCLAEGDDISDYEVNQEFLGEHIVHRERTISGQASSWPFS
jgi:hypothetical protein